MYSLGNMYTIYSIALFVALLFYIPLYFFRLTVFKKERLYLRERLGANLYIEKVNDQSIWIHAVSVGEVLSLQNLVSELKKRKPDLHIYFSSLTNSGLRVAQEKLAGVDRIFFIPLDFSFVVKRFFRKINPTLFVLAESEF